MKPSSEVEEASGEGVGMGEMMEGVVATVDAMTSAVDAVEAMVTAVEMREWLEVGRPETERTSAIHFFSRALACLEWKDEEETPHHDLPLYWPGLLPSLVQLLADCLLPHNSKAIQSGAILSLKHIIGLPWPHKRAQEEPKREMLCESHVSEHLLRLARESEDTEIREQALWMLARMVRLWCVMYPIDYATIPPTLTWNGNLDFLTLITRLIRKYAAIQEPTDTELSSLSNAIQALAYIGENLWEVESSNPEPQMTDILPVFMDLFSKAGKRESVQMQAGEFLATMAYRLNGTSVLESGMIGMVLDMLRVGNETPAVLIKALEVHWMFLISHYYGHNIDGTRQKVLGMGILDVIHLVLKRPNGTITSKWGLDSLWSRAMLCLRDIERFAEQREVVLNQEGLMELVLETAMGMVMSEEMGSFHRITIDILESLTGWPCTAKQLRRLMFKGPFIHLLARYLDDGDITGENHWYLERCLTTVKACLALQGSERELNLMRRLIDDAGITDAIHRISYYPSPTNMFDNNHLAQDILDTYFNNPIPPLPPNNLPTIIYTKNVPS